MSKVSKRGGFSDRNGIKTVNVEIQLKEFDQRTRIQLQNMMSFLYKEVYLNDLYYGQEHIQDYFRFVLGNVYSESIDVRKVYDDDVVLGMIKQTILQDEYDDVLTLIEAVIQYWDEYLREVQGYMYYDFNKGIYEERSIYEEVNDYFARECVGYRFVDGIIVPISDAYEVRTLEEALSNKYEPVYQHLSKANKFLADRDNPDYENSIKESISAVEAICEIITGVKGKEATLGTMLKKLEGKGVEIHPALKSAFSILYGYTSDANGIRHAGDIGGKASTFEEAKFMMVSCSAFINYLTALSAD